jgi:hypothetical protein
MVLSRRTSNANLDYSIVTGALRRSKWIYYSSTFELGSKRYTNHKIRPSDDVIWPSGTHVQTLKAHVRELYRLTQAGPLGPTRQPCRSTPAWSASRRGSEGVRRIPWGGRVATGDWPTVSAPTGTRVRTPLGTAACARVHARFGRSATRGSAAPDRVGADCPAGTGGGQGVVRSRSIGLFARV